MKKHVSTLAAGLVIGAAAFQFSSAASGQDGWITLEDDRQWQRFEEKVREELSIRLIASVR